MNGLLIKPIKILYCALIKGHEYKAVSPLGLPRVVVKCRYCGHKKVI